MVTARRVASPLTVHSAGPRDSTSESTRSFSLALLPTLAPVSYREGSLASQPSRASSPDRDLSAASLATKRELEELRIKVRILENRKSDDQERVKALESKVGEADTMRAARVKLQGQSLTFLVHISWTSC